MPFVAGRFATADGDPRYSLAFFEGKKKYIPPFSSLISVRSRDGILRNRGLNFITRTIDLRMKRTKKSRRGIERFFGEERKTSPWKVLTNNKFPVGWFFDNSSCSSWEPVSMCILITFIIRTRRCALVLVFAMLALASQNKTRAPTTRGFFCFLLYIFWNQASLRHFYRYLNFIRCYIVKASLIAKRKLL